MRRRRGNVARKLLLGSSGGGGGGHRKSGSGKLRKRAAYFPKPGDRREYNERYEQLSLQQRAIIDAIQTKKNVFFTGCAGTGKSYLLDFLRRFVLCGDRRVYPFTAPTGVAAVNIGGVTLHSFAGIGLGKGKKEALASSVMAKRSHVTRLKRVKVLVVDEISMVSCDLLEKIDYVLKTVRDSGKPFGGIQVVFTGDFLQLPPVSRSSAAKFAFQSPLWDKLVDEQHMLTKVYRQKDAAFVRALHQIRMGEFTPAIMRMLKSRSLFNVEVKVQMERVVPTRLFSIRKDALHVNTIELSKLPGDAKVYNAHYSGDPVARKMLGKLQAPDEIQLKVGAKVILLVNLDMENGLCNGSRGTVVSFKPAPKHESAPHFTKMKLVASEALGPFGEFPVIQFDNGIETQVLAHRFDTHAGRDVRTGKARMASKSQLPLLLGWAITQHKSQGMTLEHAQVSLGSVFEYGQAYVALSRCRSLAGLYVQDMVGMHLNNRIRAHPAAVAFYKRIQGDCVIEVVDCDGGASQNQPPSQNQLHQNHPQIEDKNAGTLEFVPASHVAERKTQASPVVRPTSHNVWGEFECKQRVSSNARGRLDAAPPAVGVKRAPDVSSEQLQKTTPPSSRAPALLSPRVDEGVTINVSDSVAHYRKLMVRAYGSEGSSNAVQLDVVQDGVFWERSFDTRTVFCQRMREFIGDLVSVFDGVRPPFSFTFVKKLKQHKDFCADTEVGACLSVMTEPPPLEATAAADDFCIEPARDVHAELRMCRVTSWVASVSTPLASTAVKIEAAPDTPALALDADIDDALLAELADAGVSEPGAVPMGGSMLPSRVRDRFLQSINQTFNRQPAAAKALSEMSEDQQHAVRAIMRGESVFLTGAAGTGKSYVVNFLLKHVLTAQPAGEVAVTASTGVAACHIDGVTVHSFAGIGHGDGRYHDLVCQVASSPSACKRINDVQLLVIDEISMISCDVFDKLEHVFRTVRGMIHSDCQDKPWGGVQLLLVGDFLQLPPVYNRHSLPRMHRVPREFQHESFQNRVPKASLMCFRSAAWNDSVHTYCELLHNYRHGDRRFHQLLSEIRQGNLSEQSLTTLAYCHEPAPARGTRPAQPSATQVTTSSPSNNSSPDNEQRQGSSCTGETAGYAPSDSTAASDAVLTPREMRKSSKSAALATSSSQAGVSNDAAGTDKQDGGGDVARTPGPSRGVDGEAKSSLGPSDSSGESNHTPQSVSDSPSPAVESALPTELFPLRKMTRRWNDRCLDELPGPVEQYHAIHLHPAKHTVLDMNDRHPDDTHFANSLTRKVLPLRIGAVVYLTRNLEVEAGLCKGTRGVVVDFVDNQDTCDSLWRACNPKCHWPRVSFDNGEEVVVTPEHESAVVPPECVSGFSVPGASSLQVRRAQLPLELGWALTIHRSQGFTLDRVSVSLDKSFAHGHVYVALSRCRSLAGLTLRDRVTPATRALLRAHPGAVQFHRRVHEHCASQRRQREAVQRRQREALKEGTT